MTFLVKRDISSNDEEGIKMKEQAILSLGNLLSKHGKAEGKVKQSSKLGAHLLEPHVIINVSK